MAKNYVGTVASAVRRPGNLGRSLAQVGRAILSEREVVMTAHSKNSLLRAILLVLLGVLAIYVGTPWLIVIIPAATLLWYEDLSILRSGRN